MSDDIKDETGATILDETKHPLYIERREMWSAVGAPIEMHSAYAYDGSYVGDFEQMQPLFNKWGIKPERREPGNKVASVGYSEKEDCWFGWSHRALARFSTREKAAKFAEEVS